MISVTQLLTPSYKMFLQNLIFRATRVYISIIVWQKQKKLELSLSSSVSSIDTEKYACHISTLYLNLDLVIRRRYFINTSKILSRANSLIANNNIRSVILEIKNDRCKIVKIKYCNNFTSVVSFLISNMTLLILLFAINTSSIFLVKEIFLYQVFEELMYYLF